MILLLRRPPCPGVRAHTQGALAVIFRFLPAGPTSDHHMTHFPGVVINKMRVCDGSMSLCYPNEHVQWVWAMICVHIHVKFWK